MSWGIVGLGRIAHSFARDCAVVGNARVVAVAARDGEHAQDFARQYDIEHAHQGYASLFENPAVDAVYIATPHSYHLQNCSDALRHGKAVLCEKPLVINPQQCRELMAVAAASGAYLSEGMWTWYLPAIRKALQWYQQGRIGTLLHLTADFGYPMRYADDVREYDAQLGASSVLEMGIYPIALARLFTGRSPERIQVSGRRAANGVDDDVIALCDYGDCVATLTTSFRCKLPNRARIIGSEGYIDIADFWRAERCSLYRLDECDDHFEDGRSSLGFDYEIEAVSRDILQGRNQSSLIPLATSLALQEDMWAIREAV